MYDDLNTEQKARFDGVQDALNPKRRGGKFKKALEDLGNFIAGLFEPSEKTQEKIRRTPKLAQSISNFAIAHRADPQLGPEMTEDVDGKLSTYTQSMLVDSEGGGFDTRDNGYGNEYVPEQGLDYDTPPRDEDAEAEWSYKYNPESAEGNSEAPEIKQAQALLMGIFGDDAVGEEGSDGFLGSGTDSAIKEFQQLWNEYSKGKDLPEDGTLNPATLERIEMVEAFAPYGFGK